MKKLLILSSNPRRDLNLDREVSDLTTAVQRLGKFEVSLGLGVRSQELTDLFAEHSPQFVHFCGHGAGEQGLVFQDENGREQLLSTEVLARIFKTFSEEINCTVLNACDSDHQAEVIVEHVNYVIGMSQPILDKAAHLFSVGFYQGLGAGKSIEQAYEMGCIAIQIWSETNAQSIQSRQYRKLEYAGAVVQPAQPQTAEYLKPVLLKKSERFLSSLTGIGSVPLTSLMLVPSEPLQGFVEYVQQEIDRKEYKDNARDAYDNFGQFSAQNASDLSKSEYEQRKILLGKVKQFWIEGFLKPSLQGVSALSLDLKSRPDAITALSQGIEALSVELDASYEKLRPTRVYEEIGQGRTLLILGSPGAGKTIALLQLAQRLIERSELNLSLPIPVVFNLSSWAKDRKSIVDWLIDELREKYQVPKSLSEPWITKQQLTLLLDGLDEVQEEYRNDCVRFLNKFIGLFPQTEVTVCSRVRDYEALTEHLQISSALCLQPLSPKQVYKFLDNVGGALTGLRMLLKSDVELERFAQTPLILNFMSVAYQGWSIEQLMSQLHSTTNQQQHLFDTYITRRLEQGSTSEYSKNQVIRWLSWLASKMIQVKQTIFLIEKLQPNWLQNRNEERDYRIKSIANMGLLFGAIAGLIAGPIYGLLSGQLIDGVLYASIYGVSGGLIGGIVDGLSKEISPLEKLSWSWKNVKSKLIREVFTGFLFGLIGGLIFALIFALSNVLLWDSNFSHLSRTLVAVIFPSQVLTLISGITSDISLALIYGLIFGLIFALIFGLIFALGSGLGSNEIEQKTIPNQGIYISLKYSLIGGFLFMLIGGLSSLSVNPGIGLITGLTIGLVIALKYGGVACIQHFHLRQMLYKKGCIPWNYAHFLNFASDRFLIKKVGGGYIFFHRMLLEHFAQMNPN